LLIDVVDAEVRAGVRVVAQNDAWVAFVPFWAAWPFETLVVPHAPVGRLDEATPSARQALGRLLRRLVRAYDAVFAVPFPYSMGLHQRSNEASVDDGVVLHAHFYPPLLRSATVRTTSIAPGKEKISSIRHPHR
jgi:UDPglucose--hexose-1-phosphate uridylyltransferase